MGLHFPLKDPIDYSFAKLIFICFLGKRIFFPENSFLWQIYSLDSLKHAMIKFWPWLFKRWIALSTG